MSQHHEQGAQVCMISRLVRPGLGDLIQRNIFLWLLRQACPNTRVTWVVGERVMTSPVRAEFVAHQSYADGQMTCPDAEDELAAAVVGLPRPVAARAVRLVRGGSEQRGGQPRGQERSDAARATCCARHAYPETVVTSRFGSAAICDSQNLSGSHSFLLNSSVWSA